MKPLLDGTTGTASGITIEILDKRTGAKAQGLIAKPDASKVKRATFVNRADNGDQT